MQSLEDYLDYLQGKGFQLHEDAIGFIYFGKRYTNASDEIINTAVEITLKAQKSFDGSFYISLLETLMVNKVKNRNDAIRFVKEKELLAI